MTAVQAPAPKPKRRARGTRARRDARAGMALVSPTVIVVVVMVVLPVLWALLLSFQRIRLIQIRRLDLLGGEYTLRNYDLLVNSQDFLEAAKNTLLYSVFGTLGAIVLGLAAAVADVIGGKDPAEAAKEVQATVEEIQSGLE